MGACCGTQSVRQSIVIFDPDAQAINTLQLSPRDRRLQGHQRIPVNTSWPTFEVYDTGAQNEPYRIYRDRLPVTDPKRWVGHIDVRENWPTGVRAIERALYVGRMPN